MRGRVSCYGKSQIVLCAHVCAGTAWGEGTWMYGCRTSCRLEASVEDGPSQLLLQYIVIVCDVTPLDP